MTPSAPDPTRAAARPPGRARPFAKAAAAAYRYRVYLLCTIIFAVMGAAAPHFLTPGNFSNVLKGTSTNLPAAVGFTIVLIAGQLDLSVGSAMTMGGILVMGLSPSLGWAGAFGVAVLCGLGLGLTNGLLVAKARINSFIVTLGTMIIVYNAMAIYCRGGTIPATTFALSDFLQRPVVDLDPRGAPPALLWLTLWLTPRNLVSLAVMAAAAVFLRRTPAGRGLHLMGGNPQAAWYSGLHVDRYVIGAFALSGLLAAVGGAVVAAGEAAGSLKLGENSLMTIVAAVIIGGTSMEGGKGTVVGTTVALVALTALINGLSCLGAGHEVQLVASGLVLALIILYDAYWLHRRQRRRGQRKDLLEELQARAASDPPAGRGSQGAPSAPGPGREGRSHG
ncbi:MAG TPA: ABC transporter permease [Phycisphaerae bacterium]|nr:ABC transporter permease [Phycisphaerae bacterium]